MTFREPMVGDEKAGIRSAKDGPFVSGAPGGIFQGIYPREKFSPAGRRVKNFLASFPE